MTRIAERYYVVDDQAEDLLAALRPLTPTVMDTPEQVASEYQHGYRAVWFASRIESFSRLSGAVRGHQNLVVLPRHALSRNQDALAAMFARVVVDGPTKVIPIAELVEVLRAPHRADLFLGGKVDREGEKLILFRGDFRTLVVPLAWFTGGPTSPEPDFDDFEIIDGGQTLRFGEYEAAGDALLYELDPDYRKRDKKRRIVQDDSFGGALRRLRLQRGLKQYDFEPVDAREIRRIEKGKVKRPHGETMRIIAQRLGVEPEEIKTF